MSQSVLQLALEILLCLLFCMSIHRYREFQEKDFSEWKTVPVQPSNSTLVTLHGLRPNKVHHFQVSSTSLHGVEMTSNSMACSTKGWSALNLWWFIIKLSQLLMSNSLHYYNLLFLLLLIIIFRVIFLLFAAINIILCFVVETFVLISF